jgi:hypothetical protein
LTAVEHYREWWPWLRRFDGERFAAGECWACAVKPQLPYVLEFEIRLTEVTAEASAHADLTGDIGGWAYLELGDDGGGCDLRLVSDLTAASGPARLIGRLVPPLAAAGHDWVLGNGVRQFRTGAFGTH